MGVRSASGPAVRPRFKARLLGGCSLDYNGRAIPESAFHRRRALFLLLTLLLAPGCRLTRDAVLDLLWPDADPRSAAAGLRMVLSDLRAACCAGSDDPPPVLRVGEAIALDPALDLDVDAAVFEAAAGAALEEGHLEGLRAALGRYGGPLLPDLPYEEWTEGPRRRLANLQRRLLEALVAREIAVDPPAAESHLRALLALDPLDEERARALMRLLDAGGRRAEALRVYEALAAALRDELDVAPAPETEALRARLQGPTVPVALPARPPRLPTPVTSFVGRRRELAALTTLLADPECPRLLTLTGAGGSGKTRLALAVAAAATAAYPEGVWPVELAAVRDPQFVARAVAAALEVREEQERPLAATLAVAIGERRVLLLLDNCEHLVDACAALAAALLAACPHLRILATSRERLNTAGELAWRVPSLALPPVPDAAPGHAELAGAEAVQLFVERARLARPGFALTEQTAALVAQICRRLDGMPLALELAAARLAVLPLEAIVPRLDDRFRLLTGGNRTALPRQQTLRATLDWSWDLLSADERVVLRRLAVFAGGWSLQAAEAICAAPNDAIACEDLLDLLAQLVHKSLVLQDEGDASGEGRYRMLETVREYTRMHLIASGEVAALLARARDWYLALAERTWPVLLTARQQEQLQALDADSDNFRAMLAWTIEGRNPFELPSAPDPDAALRLVAALWRYWEIRGAWSEGRRWIARALAMPAPASPLPRANALNGAAALANDQGDTVEAAALWEEALALKRRLGDQRSIAAALNNLSIAVQQQGDYARAAALLEESLAIKRDVDDRESLPQSLNNLGIVRHHLGELARAVELYEEAAARWRESGDGLNAAYAQLNLAVTLHHMGRPERSMALYDEILPVFRALDERWGVGAVLLNQGNLLAVRGEYAAAEALYRQSQVLWRQLADLGGLVEILESWAGLAGLQGRHARAVALYAAAVAARRALGSPMPPAVLAAHDRYLAAARAALPAPALAAAEASGAALSLDQALAYAAETPVAR